MTMLQWGAHARSRAPFDLFAIELHDELDVHSCLLVRSVDSLLVVGLRPVERLPRAESTAHRRTYEHVRLLTSDQPQCSYALRPAVEVPWTTILGVDGGHLAVDRIGLGTRASG